MSVASHIIAPTAISFYESSIMKDAKEPNETESQEGEVHSDSHFKDSKPAKELTCDMQRIDKDSSVETQTVRQQDEPSNDVDDGDTECTDSVDPNLNRQEVWGLSAETIAPHRRPLLRSNNSVASTELIFAQDLPLLTKGNRALFKMIETDLKWPTQINESCKRVVLLCFASMSVVFRDTKLTKEGIAYSRLPSVPARVARMLWSELLGNIECAKDPTTGDYIAKHHTEVAEATQGQDGSITMQDLETFLSTVNCNQCSDGNESEHGPKSQLNFFGIRFGGGGCGETSKEKEVGRTNSSKDVTMVALSPTPSEHVATKKKSWFGYKFPNDSTLGRSQHGPEPKPMFADEKDAPFVPITDHSRGRDPLLRYLRDTLAEVNLIELAGRKVDDDSDDDSNDDSDDDSDDCDDDISDNDEHNENDVKAEVADFSGWKSRKKHKSKTSQYFQIYKDMQHQYGVYLSAISIEEGGFATLNVETPHDVSTTKDSTILREQDTMKRWNEAISRACLNTLCENFVMKRCGEENVKRELCFTVQGAVEGNDLTVEDENLSTNSTHAISSDEDIHHSSSRTKQAISGSMLAKDEDKWMRGNQSNPFNDETTYALRMYPAHLMRTGRIVEAARILMIPRFFLARLCAVGAYDATRRHRSDLEELDRRSKLASEGLFDVGGDGHSIDPLDIIAAAFHVIISTFAERYPLIAHDGVIYGYKEHTTVRKHKQIMVREREPGEIGRALDVIAPMMLSQGRQAEGMKCYRIALEYKVDSLGPGHVSIARTQRHMGHEYLAIAQYEDAIKCYEEALRVERLQDVSDYKRVVLSLNSLGMIYGMTNELDKSTDYYWQSLAIEKANLGEAHLQVAETLNSLGIVYGMAGNYIKAVECYTESLNIKIERLGPIHAVVADIHLNLGQVHNKRGDRDSALASYHEALRILKIKVGDDDVEVARVLHYIGVVLSEMGDLVDAVRCYEESLRIRRNILGNEHTDVSRTLHNLGLVYYESGHNERSLKCFEETLEIGKRKLGKKNEKVADTMHSMGLVHQKLGQFEKALDSYRGALKIRRLKLGEDNLEVASTFHNMGDVYYMTSALEDAMGCYRGAYRIRLSKLGKKHLDVAATRNNMGVVYMKRNENEMAVECFTMSLKIRQRKLGADHEKCSDTLHNMGLVFKNLKKYDDAIDSYEKALKVRKLRLGDNDMKVADTQYNMAIVYANTGRYGSALQRYKEALRVYREVGMPDEHPSVVNTLQWIKWAQRKLVQTTKKGEHLQNVFL